MGRREERNGRIGRVRVHVHLAGRAGGEAGGEGTTLLTERSRLRCGMASQ